MPNWCYGSVTVEGKPEDIQRFCRYFLFEDQETPEKYFARSFIHCSWNRFNGLYLIPERNSVEFGVNFAWSGYSCLISGYPEDNPKCITLGDACKECNVTVRIETEEPGLMFTETIEGFPDGSVIHNEKDLEEDYDNDE